MIATPLPPTAFSPFELFPPEPGIGAIPIVVEVPHAGLQLDAPSLATLRVPARCIARDADGYADQLFDGAAREGAPRLVARASRYVCDLNRSEEDLDPRVCEGATGFHPHGIIWSQSSDGHPTLRAPLPRGEVERRLELVYRPYHRALTQLADERHRAFGQVLILSVHSMPSVGPQPRFRPADVVPGSRGRSTLHPRLLEVLEAQLAAAGLSYEHDRPYAGGYITRHFGHPERGRHALQLEFNRSLYLDESTLQPLPDGMARLRLFAMHLLRALAAELRELPRSR